MRWIGLDWNSHWCSERVTRRELNDLVTGVATGQVKLFLGRWDLFWFFGTILCMAGWACCTRGYPKIDEFFFSNTGKSHSCRELVSRAPLMLWLNVALVR